MYRALPLNSRAAQMALETDAIHLLDFEVTLTRKGDDPRPIGWRFQVFAARPMAGLACATFKDAARIVQEDLGMNRVAPMLAFDTMASDADRVANELARGSNGGPDVAARDFDVMGSGSRIDRLALDAKERTVHVGTCQHDEARADESRRDRGSRQSTVPSPHRSSPES